MPVLLLAVSLPAGALDVRIMQPLAGEVLLGEVEIVIDVVAEASPAVVELSVDGRSVGRLDRGPYRWIVDFGERAAPHRLEARGEDSSGSVSTATLETPGLAIDSEIEVELVPLYVTVSHDGEPVAALEREDFTLRDNGQRQRIVTFERGDVPLTAALLVDASESMLGRPLDNALAGARDFVAGMEELDQAMLLLFSDRVSRATPLTGFPEILEAALAGVNAGGGTAVNDHLFLALELLEQRRGRRVIVLLSDGLDSSSVLAMKDVLEAGRQSSALVYWLRLPLKTEGRRFTSAWRSSAQHREEMLLLERTVHRSGGQIVALARVEEALDAFRRILDELRGQYVLGYYPTVDRDDGSWHSVEIKVSRPGVKLRYRDGYVDKRRSGADGTDARE
jgi:Ca-activated chloride channel family protein